MLQILQKGGSGHGTRWSPLKNTAYTGQRLVVLSMIHTGKIWNATKFCTLCDESTASMNLFALAFGIVDY